MYVGLRDIKRFTLAASDGDIGAIKDFLFDDRSWAVRYMHADTRKWLPMGEKVLISPMSLRRIDSEEEKIHVLLSMQQVKDSPSIDEHQTVSREYEALLSEYFGYGFYWAGQDVWGEYAHPMDLAQSKRPSMKDFEDGDKSTIPRNHLRSIKELQGYNIQAKDDTFGLIYDLILDTDNWVVQYIVVDTHRLLPGGKQVLINPQHIDSINWLEHNVSSHLSAENIEHCPEYKPEFLNTQDYLIKVGKKLTSI
ncbi:hypothetical protein [Alteromonas flava]|uniref:hypothetical protein n=1 Tax=Alteromonas flava TaxID=2048003 RepID=UPI000C287A2D|nr:hypothetical protein [Alteromonas flava]